MTFCTKLDSFIKHFSLVLTSMPSDAAGFLMAAGEAWAASWRWNWRRGVFAIREAIFDQMSSSEEKISPKFDFDKKMKSQKNRNHCLPWFDTQGRGRVPDSWPLFYQLLKQTFSQLLFYSFGRKHKMLTKSNINFTQYKKTFFQFYVQKGYKNNIGLLQIIWHFTFIATVMAKWSKMASEPRLQIRNNDN